MVIADTHPVNCTSCKRVGQILLLVLTCWRLGSKTWVDEFGLNYAQMRFVQNAVPGNDRAGYSEALVGVDGQWRGIEISALPTEKGVIDY